MTINSFLSFDVEALPERAKEKPIDLLIWGKTPRGEFGINKICQILKEYQIKGNFFIDMSISVLYGDAVLKEIGEFILNQGHELHVHLHSEWLVRTWGIQGDFDGPPGLNQLNKQLNDSLIQWSFFKYEQVFEKKPIAFRSGGFYFNQYTIDAVSKAGFKCISNFNLNRHAKIITSNSLNESNEIFKWNEGLIELPVDLSPEPLSIDYQIYLNWFSRLQNRKKIKTFNLTMHSWSLLKREGEYFEEYSEEHEAKFRKIIEHLKDGTEIIGYKEYLNEEKEFENINLEINGDNKEITNIDKTVECPICHTIFILKESDVCVGCGSRSRHRQIHDFIQKNGNPFDSKEVHANFANSIEKKILLSKVSKLVNFDIRPVKGVDLQMDISNMHQIKDSSFDGFVAIHVLNHVKDDEAALREIHRILKPGGIAMITVPYREDENTQQLENKTNTTERKIL